MLQTQQPKGLVELAESGHRPHKLQTSSVFIGLFVVIAGMMLFELLLELAKNFAVAAAT